MNPVVEIDMPPEEQIIGSSPYLGDRKVRTSNDILYGARLRFVRRACKRKWTDAELARVLGVDQIRIRSWMNGYSRPDEHQKAVLAALWGCQLKDLQYI